MVKKVNYFLAVLIMFVSSFVGFVHVATAASPDITEYNLPRGSTYAFQITSGSDGALWFTETGSWKIGRMTTTGALTEYSTPAPPEDIVSGPDGALWFTEPSVDKVGRITTSGAITIYPTGYTSAPRFITVGSDGALWMEEWDASIARITTSGVVTHYPVSGTSFGGLMNITSGPDGSLWFADYSDNKIGKITTSGVVTLFTIPTANSYPYGIVGGSDGAVWFGETAGNKIGRITPDGTITEYPVPTTYGDTPHPSILVRGQDGAVWFIEENNNAIARVSSTGVFTEYQVPTTSTAGMTGLTLGPDSALWYVRYGSTSTVGRFNVQADPTPTPTPTVTPTPTLVTAIDAGGNTQGSYVADTGFSGGQLYTSSANVSTSGVDNPAPQGVYQTVRYGNFSYTIPNLTPNTTYTVRLHFNELYWNSAGQRVFNVSANGTQVLTNYDIYQAAGGANKAIVEQVPAITDGSGNITLQFSTITDNAMVNGIEVYTGAPSTTPTPTPTAGPLKVNAGGGNTGSFSGDTGFNGGQTYNTSTTVDTSGVTNPAPAAVYQTVRYGNFTYTIPNLTPNSNHTVRLHFDEVYWNSAGSRLFNVSINGSQVLSNYDVYQAAGGKDKAVVEDVPATVDSNGFLHIQFSTITDNAMVSGIEVVN